MLAVFVRVVNISVLVLRRDRVDHDHFRAPTFLPVLGAVVCVALMTQQEGAIFLRAGILLLVGAALYGINYLVAGRSPELEAEELAK